MHSCVFQVSTQSNQKDVDILNFEMRIFIGKNFENNVFLEQNNAGGRIGYYNIDKNFYKFSV